MDRVWCGDEQALEDLEAGWMLGGEVQCHVTDVVGGVGRGAGGKQQLDELEHVDHRRVVQCRAAIGVSRIDRRATGETRADDRRPLLECCLGQRDLGHHRR